MATAVPSCDQTPMTDEDLSILVFMQNHQEEKYIPDLYEDWMKILRVREINTKIREECDSWFLKCYRASNDVLRLNDAVLHSMAENRVSVLFDEFKILVTHLLCQKEKDNFCQKMSLDNAFRTIQEGYTATEWVTEAIQCVKQELGLMEKFTKRKIHNDEMANKKIEDDILSMLELQKEISECLQKLENEQKDLRRFEIERETKQEEKQNVLTVYEGQRGRQRNGSAIPQHIEFQRHKYDQLVHQTEETIHSKKAKITGWQEKLLDLFEKIQEGLCALVEDLKKEVRQWQTQFKYEYVEIAAYPNLDRVAPWCSKTGKLLYKIQHEELATWSNMIPAEQEENCKSLNSRFNHLFVDFCKSTFVVTEQDNYIVKVDKKHLPKITVRILAADLLGLSLRSSEVIAYFVLEDDLNDCYFADKLDMRLLKDKDKKLVANKVKFTTGKKKDKYEGSFPKLQFSEGFDRGSSNRLVHEEKYRIVFTTTIEADEPYWTLSLPLVVTTGANQGCCALASVMWQCFSTDVYSMPITTNTELPWCEVAQMLKLKISKLCSMRTLTEDNITHLKRRLIGSLEFPDDYPVTLKRFCFDKMDRSDKDELCSFSFWKWFLGNYNLLEKYLLDYWRDGLIEGFLSKEDAERKLKECRSWKTGMFILRFSDQNIVDSQGIKSVFGLITSTIMTIKEDEHGEKQKMINNLQLAEHKTLKEKNLANILKETLNKKQKNVYRVLYPGNRTREEAFDKYCVKSAIVEGYTGVCDAFIVDIEQAMCRLTVATGKHRSPSVDSGYPTSPASQAGCSSAPPEIPVAAPVGGRKKARTSLVETHPQLTTILSSKSSEVSNVAIKDSPSYLSDAVSNISSPQSSHVYSPLSPNLQNEPQQMLTDVPMTRYAVLNRNSNKLATISADQLHHMQFSVGSENSSAQMSCMPGNIQMENMQTVSQIPTFLSDQNIDSLHISSSTVSGQTVLVSSAPSATFVSAPSVMPCVSLPRGQHSPSPADVVEIYSEEALPYLQANICSQYPNPDQQSNNMQLQQQLAESQLANQIAEEQTVTSPQDLFNMMMAQLSQNGYVINEEKMKLVLCVLGQPEATLQDMVDRCNFQSPAHPGIEMDNTPSDMIMNSGGDFNFNTHEIAMGDQMDSGSINTAVLENFNDDLTF